jgi:hypothetical protein
VNVRASGSFFLRAIGLVFLFLSARPAVAQQYCSWAYNGSASVAPWTKGYYPTPNKACHASDYSTCQPNGTCGYWTFFAGQLVSGSPSTHNAAYQCLAMATSCSSGQCTTSYYGLAGC